MKLAGRCVLITGGASGIGYALAEAFLALGSKVAICARSRRALDRAKAAHPDLLCRVADVGDPAARLDLVAWSSEALPGLDTLVNNAGIQRDIDFTSGAEDLLGGDDEIRINLTAPIVLTGLFAPRLAAASDAALINVSSGLGFIPMASMPVYCATKAGLHAFTVAVRRQLAPLGIAVVEIVPPAVDTNLNSEGRTRRGGFEAHLDAATFVAAVMRQLADNRLEIGYGATADLSRLSKAELDRRFEIMNRAPGPAPAE